MADIKPGDRVAVAAVVESEGHDDQHVIVRIGGTPVQVHAGALMLAEFGVAAREEDDDG